MRWGLLYGKCRSTNPFGCIQPTFYCNAKTCYLLFRNVFICFRAYRQHLRETLEYPQRAEIGWGGERVKKLFRSLTPITSSCRPPLIIWTVVEYIRAAVQSPASMKRRLTSRRLWISIITAQNSASKEIRVANSRSLLRIRTLLNFNYWRHTHDKCSKQDVKGWVPSSSNVRTRRNWAWKKQVQSSCRKC